METAQTTLNVILQCDLCNLGRARLMALLVALLAIFSHNVLAQTRAEADAVKSLISHADEERSLLLDISNASTIRALAQITDANSPKSRIAQMLRSLRLSSWM